MMNFPETVFIPFLGVRTKKQVPLQPISGEAHVLFSGFPFTECAIIQSSLISSKGLNTMSYLWESKVISPDL